MNKPVLRYRRETILGVGLALFAFGAYAWTLCPSVFPESSALAVGSVLHTDSGHQLVGHPLWHSAARLFSLLPLGDVPFRLNLFSALCGAGVVFFLFRLVTLILYDVLSEERWIEQIDEDLGSDELPTGDAGTSGIVREMLNGTGHRIAMAGGVVSALAFAFCSPFWQASTSLHYQTFELLLLLSAAYALARYYATSSLCCLVMAAFLLGLGVVESVSCLIFLPISLIYFSLGGYRHGHISPIYMALLLLCFAGGALLAVATQVAWISQGGFSTPHILKIVSLWVQSNAEGIGSIMTHKGWLLILTQGVLPLLIVFKMRHRFAYDHFLNIQTDCDEVYEDRNPEANRRHVAKLFWGIILFFLLAWVVHGLLNLPGSPWYFSRGSAYLPVLPLLSIAMTFGFLLSYALLYRHRHLVIQANSDNAVLSSPPSRSVYAISGGLAVATCVLIAVTVFQNRGELREKKVLLTVSTSKS